MQSNSPAADAISNIRSITENLTPEQREQVKDELLAFLLFDEGQSTAKSGEANDVNQRVQGLSDAERDLIKKLARQTEELYRKMNSQEDLNEDQ